MRKLLLFPALLAVYTAVPVRAQTTRPALAQLDAEMRALHADVASGTVRVQLPLATVARLMEPEGHPRWHKRQRELNEPRVIRTVNEDQF